MGSRQCDAPRVVAHRPYTGDHKPARMSDADYARVRNYSGHSPEEFRAYLATYDIP